MYEVETKVELTAEQADVLRKRLEEFGFKFTGLTLQKDFYIEAKKSPFGGRDLKRYRQEGDEFFYTQKTWEMVGDTPARNEIDHTVSKEEFERETAKAPDAVRIIKDREWFEGSWEGKEISMVIDSVKFDHSSGMRYFTEAEIPVEDINNVKATKEFVGSFLAAVLDTPEGIKECPAGMLGMALDKL